jgi:hypothetical protein
LNEIKLRHKREIMEFEKNCPHNRLSDWEHDYTPEGKLLQEYRRCHECGNKIKRRWQEIVWKED